MDLKFRPLKAEEIECRINQIKEGKEEHKGKYFAICLLYKDARCDQRILDETVGAMNWQRKHAEHNNNLFCSVGIYDKDKKEWVWKEDAGAESNMDAQKGHASDSFKRACFNWGIGRELYTPLFIYFQLNKGEWFSDKGKIKSNAKFHVKSVTTTGEIIKQIEIADRRNVVRWKI